MAEEVRKVTVHYRKAVLDGGPEDALTLQEALTTAMARAIGHDARERMLPMSDDDKHRGCLNFSKSNDTAFVADIMHLDGRSSLPMWMIPDSPRPVAEVIPRNLAKGEASLSEPVYMYVRGNHVAVIERMGFRNTNLARYLNELLRKAGSLPDGASWTLAPKITVSDRFVLDSGVKRIVVKPHAALGGEAPSQAPVDANKRRGGKVKAAIEDFIAQGAQVVDVMKAIGVSEARVEELKELMSSDLVIKAKVEFSVNAIRKRSTATISEEDVERALGNLAVDGDVTILSADGTKRGKLLQLAHQAEVVEKDGLIVWDKAVSALTAAISAWDAKGAIELG